MKNKNWLTGAFAATAIISALSTPVFAQRYYGYAAQNDPVQFNQQVPMQPSYAPTPFSLNAQNFAQPPVTYVPPAPVQQAHMEEPYTPNVNGVPIDPNTPRAGLNRNGFGYGSAFNQWTTPAQYQNYAAAANAAYGNPNCAGNYTPSYNNYAPVYSGNYGPSYNNSYSNANYGGYANNAAPLVRNLLNGLMN